MADTGLEIVDVGPSDAVEELLLSGLLPAQGVPL